MKMIKKEKQIKEMTKKAIRKMWKLECLDKQLSENDKYSALYQEKIKYEQELDELIEKRRKKQMKTIENLRDYLLANYVDEYGNLFLSDLDFSDFEGNVTISGMKVQGNLYQSYHEVKGNLFQIKHEVRGDLYQYNQEVRGNLSQESQEVQGNLYQGGQEVDGDYYCTNIKVNGSINTNEPTKLLKKINAKELEKLGYVFEGGN